MNKPLQDSQAEKVRKALLTGRSVLLRYRGEPATGHRQVLTIRMYRGMVRARIANPNMDRPVWVPVCDGNKFHLGA